MEKAIARIDEVLNAISSASNKTLSANLENDYSQCWQYIECLSSLSDEASLTAVETLWSGYPALEPDQRRLVAEKVQVFARLVHEGHAKVSFAISGHLGRLPDSEDDERLREIQVMIRHRSSVAILWRIRWALLCYQAPPDELVRALLAGYIFERCRALGEFPGSASELEGRLLEILFNALFLIAFDTYSLGAKEIVAFDLAIRKIMLACSVESLRGVGYPAIAAKLISGKVGLLLEAGKQEHDLRLYIAPALAALEEMAKASEGSHEFKKILAHVHKQLISRRSRMPRNKRLAFSKLAVGINAVIASFSTPFARNKALNYYRCDLLDDSEDGVRLLIEGHGGWGISPGNVLCLKFDEIAEPIVGEIRWVRKFENSLTVGVAKFPSVVRLVNLRIQNVLEGPRVPIFLPALIIREFQDFGGGFEVLIAPPQIRRPGDALAIVRANGFGSELKLASIVEKSVFFWQLSYMRDALVEPE